jgi:hypothetical protein
MTPAESRAHRRRLASYGREGEGQMTGCPKTLTSARNTRRSARPPGGWPRNTFSASLRTAIRLRSRAGASCKSQNIEFTIKTAPRTEGKGPIRNFAAVALALHQWLSLGSAKAGERTMRIGTALLVCCILGGCQTTEERVAADDRQCQSYGVQPGSPAYVQCRMNLDNNRAAVKASERFGNSGGLAGAIERWSET